ncbi:MAG: hydrogenase maturation nickel metallochaperone HypA [Planctomycetota bacterium]
MHEESLARSLLQRTTELCQLHHARNVVSVRVSCGPLSGVEPTQLHDAFTRLKATLPACHSATLILEDPGMPARCEACRHSFDVIHFRFLCPQCSSGNIRLLDGDCLRILDVELEVEEPGRSDSGVTHGNDGLQSV